jgi:hypothetical protein
VREKKHPYQDEIMLCNTLITYLQRYVSNTDLDLSSPGVMVTPAVATLTSPSEETPPSGKEKTLFEILQETLLNSDSNDLLPLMVGQSHDSFALLSVKNVMSFQHCQQAIQLLCMGNR